MKHALLFLACLFAMSQAQAQNPIIRCEGELCALADAQNFQLITPYKYAYIEPFEEGFAMAMLHNEKGKRLQTYLNTKGQELILPTENQLFPFVKGKAIFKEKDKYGFLDKAGQIILPAQYKQCHNFSEGMAFVEMPNGARFFINEAGETLFEVNSQYTEVGKCIEGFIKVLTQTPEQQQKYEADKNNLPDALLEGSYAYLDRQGKVVLKLKNIRKERVVLAHDFRNGLAKVLLENQKGVVFINTKGEVVLPATPNQMITPQIYRSIKYRLNNENVEEIQPIGDYWLVEQAGEEKFEWETHQYGLLSPTGKEILPTQYQEILPVWDKYCLTGKSRYTQEEINESDIPADASKTMSFMLMDTTGKLACPFVFEELWASRQGQILGRVVSKKRAKPTFLLFETQGVLELYDFSGKALSRALQPYFYFQCLKNDEIVKRHFFCPLRFGKNWTLVNRATHEILTDWVDEIAPFTTVSSLAEIPMRKGKTWQFMNRSFEMATAFEEADFAPVRQNRKWALLHRVGKETTPYQYDSIVPNVWRVKYEDRMPSIEVHFTETSIEHTKMFFLPKNHFLACQNKRWGVINGFGNVVVPFENDEVLDVFVHYLLVKRAGKQGLIDYAGKILFPFQPHDLKIIDDFVYMKVGKKTKFYELGGAELTPEGYDEIDAPNPYGINVKQKGKVGRINEAGKEIVPPLLDEIENGRFAEPMKRMKGNPKCVNVRIGKLWGAFDINTGKLAVPCQYKEVMLWETQEGQVEKQYYVVKTEKYVGLCDATGKEILPTKYQNIRLSFWNKPHHIPIVHIWENKLQGLADVEGNLLLPAEYERIDYLKETQNEQVAFKAKKEGKWQAFAIKNGQAIKIPLEIKEK